MNRHALKLTAWIGVALLFGGALAAASTLFRDTAESWMVISSVAAIALGVAALAVSSRHFASRTLVLKRIVSIALFGITAPIVLGFEPIVAIPNKSLRLCTMYLVCALAFLGISRITPLRINSWFEGRGSLPPNKSLERTREG